MANALRITPKKPAKEETSELTLNTMLDRYWGAAESARKQLDWKWFQHDLFVNGHHYVKYDKSTQQIKEVAPTGSAKVVVNKVYSTLRGVRSYILQNRPKAEVTPVQANEQNLDQAIIINQYLDYLHDRLGLRQKVRATLWHSLKYSVGFWQIMWDEETEEIVVNVIDPYDLYIDPSARVMKEARYMILAVRRNLEDLKEDPKYKDFDWSQIKSDSKLASSNLKSRMMQFERGDSTNGGGSTNDGTVIVKEFWYKEANTEDVEVEDPANPGQKKKMKKAGHKIMLCTKINDQMIRKPIDTGLNRFPFFKHSSDIEPLSMYGTGWVKNLIPLQKELNRVESSIAEYNVVVNKARFVVDKGAGLTPVTNQHGTFFEKKKGFDLSPYPMPTLSNEAQASTVRFGRYIEDLGCLHDASMGRQSSSDQSGRSIEALQEGDSNNLSELIENTEEFLEDTYEYMLYLGSQKYQYLRNITTKSQSGQRQAIQLIGESAAEEMKTEGAVVIPEKTIVDVKISSYLAYTSEGRRQAMKDLVTFPQMQNLPPEYILEAYATGNIADIVKQMREENEKQKEAAAQEQQQQMEMQGQQQEKQMQMQTQQQAQQASMQKDQELNSGAGSAEAIAIIKQLMNGVRPEIPANVSPEFIAYLDHFVNSPEGQQQDPALLEMVEAVKDNALLHMRGNSGTVEPGT